MQYAVTLVKIRPNVSVVKVILEDHKEDAVQTGLNLLSQYLHPRGFIWSEETAAYYFRNGIELETNTMGDEEAPSMLISIKPID